MTSVAATASVVAGSAVVLLVLRDVFHALLHPAGAGSLSRALQRGLWGGFRRVARRRRGALQVAGPTTLVAILATWGALLALGWALVFWPFLPEGFRFASPLAPAAQGGFLDALYFSSVVLTTLGFGDVTPTRAPLRLLATVEAAVGFALLTAGISWVLSIYPVLSRRRALAQRTFLLEAGERQSGCRLAELEASVAAAHLSALAAALAQVRVDLAQSTVSYYFADVEEALALPAALPLLARFADEGGAAGRPDAVRFAAAELREAVSAYAERVRTAHLRLPPLPVGDVIASYATDYDRDVRAAASGHGAPRGHANVRGRHTTPRRP